MAFEGKLNKDFVIKDNHIELSPAYVKELGWRFKKVTGTKFSKILGMSKYNSPFKEWCVITLLHKEEMDPTLSKIGQLAEPKIRDYVTKTLGIKFKVYEPAACKWDVFKDVDKVYGGIPDGEPIDVQGNLAYAQGLPMLEVKSSSIDKFVYKTIDGELRMQKDANGVPQVKLAGGKKLEWFNSDGSVHLSDEYKAQLGLYLYLRGVEKGMFAVGFLTPDEYVHPEKFVASANNVIMVNFNLTNKEAFKKYVDQGREWYNKYVKGGISPTMTEEDKKWLKEMLKL